MANWGLFLCNCRQTLPLDPEKLVLPIAPSVLFRASDPERQIPQFADQAKSGRLDRVMIACCVDAASLEKAFNDSPPDSSSTKLDFLNLRESCFLPHADAEKAHAKAARLLRAAMECAEPEIQPSYNPLKVEDRVVVACEESHGEKIAGHLRDVAKPIFVFPEGEATTPRWTTAPRGRVVEVKGRLGDFRVTIEHGTDGQAARDEIKADQVVIVTAGEAPPVKARTGCHVLISPSDLDFERLAESVRGLIGDFQKLVHVTYNAAICAGGNADQEACGVCVSACPYEAIRRDPADHLRMQVDHMTCEGCGACVSACPTSALAFTEPSPGDLYKRMEALLMPPASTKNGEASIILFHCGEHGRRLLAEAGQRPLPYPASCLPVEVPCLRYVSEANVLAAFRLGAAGVGVLGCEKCQHGKRELLYQQLDFSALTLDAFALGADRIGFFTTDYGKEEETIEKLTQFAESLSPSRIHWDGKPVRRRGNREVVADAIRSFIDQTASEPGRKPVDAHHPYAVAEVAEAGCTMCRSCVNVCPTHAFKLDEPTQTLRLKQIECVACGLCERVCPENVITLRREVEFDREALDYKTVVEDSMIVCAQCGKPYINKKALETVEARVFSLPGLFDTFTGNRRNLLRMCPDCRSVAAMLEVDKGWKP